MDPLTDWLTGWGAGCTLPPAPDCLLCLLTLLLCLLELSQFLPLFVSLSCLYVILLLSLCYAPSISLCLPIYRDAFSKAFLYFTTTVAESTTRITSGQSLLFFLRQIDRRWVKLKPKNTLWALRPTHVLDLLQPGQVHGAPWVIFKLGAAIQQA